MGIDQIRTRLANQILAKQDSCYRWGFDECLAQQHPEYLYYWPKYRATLWTLLFLAEIKAPLNLPAIEQALTLVMNHFFDEANHIFSLGNSHFPIPCLNGNLLYLHFNFRQPHMPQVKSVIEFFSAYQRFDDGDFKTPNSYPYFSNTACYGKHTCYWGIVKLLKGLSFIPVSERTATDRGLIENCIEFVLHHEVCFQSHHKDELIHPEIDQLTFPAIRNDFLEILWLLKREGVQDPRMMRAENLLRSKMNDEGEWELERPMTNLIIPAGRKGFPNAFVTERALEVFDR